MRINLILSWKGSVGRTGRNPAPRPTFKREKRKAEAIGSIKVPDASFILKVVFGGVRGRYTGLVPGRLAGSVQRPPGLVRFCFVFYPESSGNVSLPHRSAQPAPAVPILGQINRVPICL